MKRQQIILSALFLFVTTLGFSQEKLKLNLNSTEQSTVQKDHNPFIEQLKEGEEMTIRVESIGCFNQTLTTIQIRKVGQQYVMSYGDKVLTLDADFMQDMIGFESDLANLGKGNCSSTDVYTLSYQGQQLRVSDSTCSWNGIQRLTNRFRNE